MSYLALAAEVGYYGFLHRLAVDWLRGQPMGDALSYLVLVAGSWLLWVFSQAGR